MTSNLFTCDYVEYDKYGLKEVRCMASGDPIKTRMEEVSRVDPSKFVYVLGKHVEYREVPVLMQDGSVAFIMLSEKYLDVDIGEAETEKISTQILRAKKLELEAQGLVKEVVQAVLDNAKDRKRVLRRLTPDEIKEKFGGE